MNLYIFYAVEITEFQEKYKEYYYIEKVKVLCNKVGEYLRNKKTESQITYN